MHLRVQGKSNWCPEKNGAAFVLLWTLSYYPGFLPRLLCLGSLTTHCCSRVNTWSDHILSISANNWCLWSLNERGRIPCLTGIQVPKCISQQDRRIQILQLIRGIHGKIIRKKKQKKLNRNTVYSTLHVLGFCKYKGYSTLQAFQNYFSETKQRLQGYSNPYMQFQKVWG